MAYVIDPPETAKTSVDDMIRTLEGSGSRAVSPKGALGRYQIMPATARAYGFDPAKLKDDAYSKKAMHAIVGDLVTQFDGDRDAVLVAYNAGPGKARQWLKSGKNPQVLPEETQRYLAHANTIHPSQKVDQPPETQYIIDPPAKPTPVQKARQAPESTTRKLARNAIEPVRNLPGDIGQAFSESRQQYSQDFDRMLHPRSALDADAMGNFAKLGGDVLGMLSSPITGAARALVGRPTETVTGSPAAGRAAEIAAGFAVPVAAEARLANAASKLAREEGISVNAARQILQRRPAALPKPARPAVMPAEGDNSYGARVQRLQNEGIHLTPGRVKGGAAARQEDIARSSPYKGQAMVEAHNESIRDLNRALYNRALRPIGEFYSRNMEVGRQGVGYVRRKLNAAYQEILPNVRVNGNDERLNTNLRTASEEAHAILPKDRANQLDGIIHRYIGRHFETNGKHDPAKFMTGEQFKDAESALTREARAYKSVQDPDQNKLGWALDDVVGELRAAAERSSPVKVRSKLKAANEGWAVYTRIRDAAARRTTVGEGSDPGVITPGDLMAAVKRGDSSVRKGRFAEGEAFLQQLADDAATVLPSKIGDSGTATRTRQGLVGGIIGAGAGGAAAHALGGGPIGGTIGAATGAALGGAADARVGSVTNALARRMLMRPRQPIANPRNYMNAISHRLAPAAIASQPPPDQ